MPITTTAQPIFDGNRTVSYQYTGISDGSGNLTGAVLVDPTALSPKAAAVKVVKISGTVSYGVVELSWDALPPVKFAELSGDSICIDYSRQGALNNKIAGPDATGKILISTLGFSAGSTYSLTIDMTKRYTDKVPVV